MRCSPFLLYVFFGVALLASVVFVRARFMNHSVSTVVWPPLSPPSTRSMAPQVSWSFKPETAKVPSGVVRRKFNGLTFYVLPIGPLAQR